MKIKNARFAGAALLMLPMASTLGCSGDESTSTSTGASTGTTSSSSSSSSSGSGGGGGMGDPLANAVKANDWVKLTAGPSVSAGKQDDIFFTDAKTGFVASGPNTAIFGTVDGGATWSNLFTHTGTFFRSVLFVDSKHGFAGNIGAGLSPSISDATLIYETKDGGASWAPSTNITGAMAKGLCNFTEVDATHIVGVGRANGPADLLVSNDSGATWTATDLATWLGMAIDAHFTSPTEGIVAGMDPTFSHCSIIQTTDGGATFKEVFKSKTSGSLCWKFDFPSAKVGYATVQDSANGPPTFAKTLDGGTTWMELPLPLLTPATKGYNAIGVGFISENIGWMSAESPTLPTYRTFDGGMTWEVDPALKSPINRFRFVDAHTAYAVGGSVWKLVLP